MANSRADYQRLVDLAQSSIESVEGYLASIPKERMPIAHYGLGIDSLNVAIGHWLLGNPADARCWFRESVDHYLQSGIPLPDTVVPEMRSLECAVLGGDQLFRSLTANAIPERNEQKRKPQEYSYVMFLKCIIVGRSAEATAHAAQAAAQSPAVMKKRGGYAMLGEACQALAARDPAAFKAALEALLAEHRLKAAHGLRRLALGYVCLPGAALLLLARDLGMKPEVQSPFIPGGLPGSS